MNIISDRFWQLVSSPSALVKSIFLLNILLFLVGVVIGLERPGEAPGTNPASTSSTFSMTTILSTNIQFAFVLFVLTTCLLWIVSAVLLFVNGFALGVLIVRASEMGLSTTSIVGAVVFHGVFEVTAFALAASIGLGPIRWIARYVQGAEDRLWDREVVIRVTKGCLIVLILLVVSAVVESTISIQFVK